MEIILQMHDLHVTCEYVVLVLVVLLHVMGLAQSYS